MMSLRFLVLAVLIAVLYCPSVSAQQKRGGSGQNAGNFWLPPSQSWFGELSEPYGNVSEATARHS